jgi:hypothetical protein
MHKQDIKIPFLLKDLEKIVILLELGIIQLEKFEIWIIYIYNKIS